MTKKEFLSELEMQLHGLPKHDLEDRVVFYSEIIDDKDSIIRELGYTLKESREYSVVYNKNGLYDIVSYNYINTKDGITTIRRKFELDLL